jgi:hypothetical protein
MNSTPEPKRIPSGYRPGPLKGSDGTRYMVEETGQIRRLDRKMSKAERKRHKKERRLENLRGGTAGGDACPTGENP